jgi:nitroreductase
MELGKCIKGRRSVRAFKDKPVPKRKVEKILDAGSWAPSGMNAQPWRFIVIQQRATIELLSARTKQILLSQEFTQGFRKMLESNVDTVFYGAPLLIFICIEKNEEWKSVNLLDTGLAAQNMFLMAHELGLGSCFIGFGNFLNSDPDVLESIGVPRDHELVAPLIFGYPAEKPKAKPRTPKILKWIA